MPTYEYRCPSGHLFEKSVPRITSKRHATCPTCGKRAERLISGGAGLVFKGSGFYATDYRKKPVETAEKPAEKPADKPADTPAAPPAESKPTKPKK